MQLLLLVLLAPIATALFRFQSPSGYQFRYDTRDSGGPAKIFREEKRGMDGTVIGKYGYEDPYGILQVVNYRVGEAGYEIINPADADQELAVRSGQSPEDQSVIDFPGPRFGPNSPLLYQSLPVTYLTYHHPTPAKSSLIYLPPHHPFFFYRKRYHV
ncbi:adult-specific rigid cuticular protein 11.9-like [Tachypleus tridentatus]|uniref:adult-specific rigid cuticular protein 11.9-like n=1 Tax=Tachypleus tridentatus TaxID=6853 RepID=UPI003FCF2F80